MHWYSRDRLQQGNAQTHRAWSAWSEFALKAIVESILACCSQSQTWRRHRHLESWIAYRTSPASMAGSQNLEANSSTRDWLDCKWRLQGMAYTAASQALIYREGPPFQLWGPFPSLALLWNFCFPHVVNYPPHESRPSEFTLLCKLVNLAPVYNNLWSDSWSLPKTITAEYHVRGQAEVGWSKGFVWMPTWPSCCKKVLMWGSSITNSNCTSDALHSRS